MQKLISSTNIDWSLLAWELKKRSSPQGWTSFFCFYSRSCVQRGFVCHSLDIPHCSAPLYLYFGCLSFKHCTFFICDFLPCLDFVSLLVISLLSEFEQLNPVCNYNYLYWIEAMYSRSNEVIVYDHSFFSFESKCK